MLPIFMCFCLDRFLNLPESDKSAMVKLAEVGTEATDSLFYVAVSGY